MYLREREREKNNNQKNNENKIEIINLFSSYLQ